MIPPLDHRGLLPDGIHVGTWKQIEQAFCTDPRREQLIASAKNFSLSVLHLLNPSPLYLAGSTFSDLPFPNDIESTIKCNPSNLNQAQLGLMFQLLSQHDQIKNSTEVDFYVTIDIPGQNDFTEFFRYVGEKTGMKKNLKPKDKRGMVEVNQWLTP